MSHAQIDKIVTEQNLSKLLPYLKKQSNDSLAAVSTLDPLDQLNPAVHSLGYLFVLKARLARPAKKDTAQNVMQRIAVFLQTFDPKQVRAAPAEFHDLVFDFAAICDRNLQMPMFALASLKMAIHRYAKSLSHLTSIHYIFVKQCLLAKCFDEALGILDIPIDDLDLGTHLIYQHYLQYYYYGCMIYISLKNFQSAYDFAKIAITAPGSACSAIQLESYKKYILLSLILHGKVGKFPSYTNFRRLQSHLQSRKLLCGHSSSSPDLMRNLLNL
jgi:COP9 signalosome complex subunit 3